MARTMKAYRLIDWQKPPQTVEVEVPRPAAGEVLIKIAGNGLCHSDIGMMQMPAIPGWNMPFTLGHEAGGWIDECGDGVKGYAKGDPVVLVSPHSDGTCEYCLAGHDNDCEQAWAGRGFGRDGGLAEYMLVGSTRSVIKLTTLDPATAGPLTDAGGTSYHAVKRVLPKLHPGTNAVVIGAGGLGGFAIQFLRVLSATRIIAIDNNPGRLAIAREFGAHEAIAGVGPSTADDIRKLTGGRGAEVVFDFVGNDSTIEAGLALVRKTGSFALVGAGGGTLKQVWWPALPKDGEVFTFQGPTIQDTREVITLVEAGLVRNEVDLFPFSRVEEAYAKLDSGKLRGRAVVTPDPV